MGCSGSAVHSATTAAGSGGGGGPCTSVHALISPGSPPPPSRWALPAEPEITERAVSDPLSLPFLGRVEARPPALRKLVISKADENFARGAPAALPRCVGRGTQRRELNFDGGSNFPESAHYPFLAPNTRLAGQQAVMVRVSQAASAAYGGGRGGGWGEARGVVGSALAPSL